MREKQQTERSESRRRRYPNTGDSIRAPDRDRGKPGDVNLAVELATGIVRRCDREHPADALLRAELGRRRDLPAAFKREVSQLVFAYFRWFGWLEGGAGLRRNLARAAELDQRFRTEAASFTDQEMKQRALPAWVHGEFEVRAAFVRSLQNSPVLWLRARPGQGAKLARALGECVPAGSGSLGDALEYGGTEDLFRTDAFRGGRFEIQDLSSQAVGLLCRPKPGETWWDMCAGEGGKMLHLADLMGNRGLVWATDRSPTRLRQLKRRAARAGLFNYRMTQWDEGPKLPFRTKFDGVLVDAPCSGIGTWHRNPHARWTTTPADVRELAELQGRLLASAALAVKPGGRLIYAVCTVSRAETTEVAGRFEAAFQEFEPFGEPDPLSEGGETKPVHLWRPERHRGNGMYVAVWRRRGKEAETGQA